MSIFGLHGFVISFIFVLLCHIFIIVLTLLNKLPACFSIGYTGLILRILQVFSIYLEFPNLQLTFSFVILIHPLFFFYLYDSFSFLFLQQNHLKAYVLINIQLYFLQVILFFLTATYHCIERQEVLTYIFFFSVF